jgi:hypothetical protein
MNINDAATRRPPDKDSFTFLLLMLSRPVLPMPESADAVFQTALLSA